MKDMNKYSDDRLVTLFAEGCGSAFDALYERYNRQVYGYVLSLTHDVTLTDDLTQDIYLKVISGIAEGKYRHDDRLINWILCVAHNVVFDYFRERQKMNFISNGQADYDDIIARIELADTGAADAEAREDVFLSLESCIRALPDAQRIVIEQHYFRHLTFREIAERGGESINTALGRMHYAHNNLRKALSMIG